jgi:3-methyladenine DNA glycosylase AlkD
MASGKERDHGVTAIAKDVLQRIARLSDRSTASLRSVRKAVSKEIKGWPTHDVFELALRLAKQFRWFAYELVYHHPGALPRLDADLVERLGEGMSDWGAVDAFGRYISGPAWRHGAITDAVVRRWARSDDSWWRRAALVSTVPLNLRAAGGTGDASRTLDICRRLAGDRDDMVVKALSWALRELALWDARAVRAFLHEHQTALHARVRREVQSKLDTGRKHAPRVR